MVSWAVCTTAQQRLNQDMNSITLINSHMKPWRGAPAGCATLGAISCSLLIMGKARGQYAFSYSGSSS